MEVLLEPFDDIVPRPRPAAPPPSASEEEARRKRKKEKKNLSLLSFGEEAEQEERALKKARALTSALLYWRHRLIPSFLLAILHARARPGP